MNIYNASENGGSTYDNLKELYSKWTDGEEAQGSNIAEVVEELKSITPSGGPSILENVIFTKVFDQNNQFSSITCNKSLSELVGLYNDHIGITYTMVNDYTAAGGDTETTMVVPFTVKVFYTGSEDMGFDLYNTSDEIQVDENTIRVMIDHVHGYLGWAPGETEPHDIWELETPRYSMVWTTAST